MSTTGISFEEWIKRIFDIPTGEINYFYDQPRSLWSQDAAPQVTFEYMTQLFENPLEILKPFSDDQHKWGLYYIGTNSPTKAEYLALDEVYRNRCIRSFYKLFKEFFVVVCWPDPFDAENRHHVNAACFLWWSNLTIQATPENPNSYACDMEFLNVMRDILTLSQ